MKTDPTTLLIIALIFWEVTFGQQETLSPAKDPITEIVIDLNDEQGVAPAEIEKYNALKRGDFFRLRIDNVNTYLYEINVSTEDVDRTVPLPESLLDLVNFGGLKSSLGNLNSPSGIVKKFVALESNTNVQRFNTEDQSIDDLKEYFAVMGSDYKLASHEIEKRYIQIDALFVRAEDFQNTMTSVHRDLLGPTPSKDDIKALLDSFEETKSEILDIKAELVQKNIQFLTVIETNKEALSKNKELKASAAEIKKVHESLVKASDDLMAQLSSKNYAQFSAVLIGILNNLDFSYTTLPIQRYGDATELVITLKPRDKNAKLSGYSTVLRMPDIEKSFWGVSSGFYVTGNPERAYSLVERVENGQTFYDFLREDTAKAELGINTLIRYGRRLGEVLDTPTFWHFGFGAGLSIDQKFKPRLMAGTGLAWGGNNKLFVDVGAIHMYYDTISKAYDLKGNTVLPEDFLVNATKLQGYFSLGYLIAL